MSTYYFKILICQMYMQRDIRNYFERQKLRSESCEGGHSTLHQKYDQLQQLSKYLNSKNYKLKRVSSFYNFLYNNTTLHA